MIPIEALLDNVTLPDMALFCNAATVPLFSPPFNERLVVRQGSSHLPAVLMVIAVR
jgi:hypothetical protein